jgi:hypothetical protein
MRTTQYVRQERAIAVADKGGIRERWMWGLRLLRDPEAMSSEKSLKHGVTDELIAAATARDFKLSAREIQYRLQCARAYPTEAEIRKVLADFETWWDLIQANFPAYEAPKDEPPADHRTEPERRAARGRALLDAVGDQGTLFPLDEFEPSDSTLKELQEYAVEMQELTARFAERDRKRRTYLDQLIRAADGDLSVTWKEAHDRLGLTTEAGDDFDPPIDEEDGI